MNIIKKGKKIQNDLFGVGKHEQATALVAYMKVLFVNEMAFKSDLNKWKIIDNLLASRGKNYAPSPSIKYKNYSP